MNRKRLKKWMQLCAMTLALTLLAACGGAAGSSVVSEDAGASSLPAASGTAVDGPGWKQDTSPITFTMLIADSSFTQKWGEDPVSRAVTEKTGVTLDISIPNTTDSSDLLATLIAANDLPDIILASSEQAWADFIDGGLVYSLDELAQKYDPEFYNVVSEEIVNWHRHADGNLYWYPVYAWDSEHIEEYGEYMTGYYSYFVRKDIYEGIGSPDLRTPEGFLDALRKVKEKYPTINGQPVQMLGTYEFGETGSWTFDELLQNCLNIPYEVDNKWIDRRTDPEYRKWIGVFRQAYEEGLISETMMVDTWDQTKERLARGEYFSMLGMQDDFTTTFAALAAEDPNSTYIPVDPPANAALDDPLFTAGSIKGWLKFGISKNCEDPERAIRFLTYLLSEEGQQDFYLGIEGETYETVDGVDQLKPEVLAAEREGWGSVRKYGAGTTWHVFKQPNIVAQWQYQNVDDEEVTVMTPFKEYFRRVGCVPMLYTSGVSLDANTPENDIQNQMNLKFGELLPKMIMAESEEALDALWKEYDDYAESIDYQSALDALTEKMLANKKKLGMIS